MHAPDVNGESTGLLNTAAPAPTLQELISDDLDLLPLPGQGCTLERWRMFAKVARCDLSLVKLFEGHTDALAIMVELGALAPLPFSRWGTWCAEPPDARVNLRRDPDTHTHRLAGRKAWCSGASIVTHAVVSCWNAQDQQCLAAVALDQPGVTVTYAGWKAVGMADTCSVDVHFENADATCIGEPGDYVRRRGFWHGGAGIAACWYGGAQAIAEMTLQLAGPRPDAHQLAHLGAMDVSMAGAAAVLRETALWIDSFPLSDAKAHTLRARLVVERAATEVIWHAGRALGAGPLCREARFARVMADLPVFLRQSHAERDLATLGERVLVPSDLFADAPWRL